MVLLAARAYSTGAGGLFDAEAPPALVLQCVLAGGDDYELVFTAPPAQAAAVQAAARASGTPVTRIGRTEAMVGVRVVDGSGALLPGPWASFDHFATPPHP